MQHAIPDGLAEVPTGSRLSALLESIELSAVPDADLLTVLSTESRQLAYQQARVWATMVEVARRDPMPSGEPWTPEQVFESAVDEVRAELRLTRRSARRELTHADMVAAHSRVFAALESGKIDRGRAIVLAEGCADLTDEQTGKLLDKLLPEATTVTATGLAERVRRVAIALDPDWAQRRYREAVRDRRIIGYLNDDGSATVSGQYLPADQAAAACARVDALAKSAKRSGAGAPIDHLRAELFLGLLDGRFHGMTEASIVAALLQQYPASTRKQAADPAATAEAAEPAEPDDTATATASVARRGVELRVGLGTLLGLDDQPGEISGWGPVTAAVARETAARQRRAEWRFAIVDGDGRLLFDGTTRRRPRLESAAPGETKGGIVELHVPQDILDRTDLPASWAGVLADLAAQHAARQRPTQDPRARFPGRPQRRRSQIQFQRCVFPGCRRPATDCDLDHHRDFTRGGRTVDENLGPGCRHDHMNKTARGWRLIRRDPHTLVWISPLGRRHTVRVEPVAAPLPAPIPRQRPVESDIPDHPLHEFEASFEPRTRRGRPLLPGPTIKTGSRRTVESGVDPPPF